MRALSFLLGIVAICAPGRARAEAPARFCVVRTANVMGSAIPLLVRVQERPLAMLKNGRSFCVEAEPGEYVVSVGGNFLTPVTVFVPTVGVATGVGGTQTLGDVREVTLGGGETLYLRAWLNRGQLLWNEVDAAFFQANGRRIVKPADLMLDQWPDRRLVVDPS